MTMLHITKPLQGTRTTQVRLNKKALEEHFGFTEPIQDIELADEEVIFSFEETGQLQTKRRKTP